MAFRCTSPASSHRGYAERQPLKQQPNPFMPIEDFGRMNDTEKRALWAYFQTLAPEPLGGR